MAKLEPASGAVMASGQGLTAEQLAQLKTLIDVVAPRAPDWTDTLKAVGEFVGHIAWPTVALIGLLLFRGPIGRVRMLAYKDVKVLIDRQLDRAGDLARAADPTVRKGAPTSDEVARSGEVAALVEPADLADVRTSALALAAEYETMRASMPSGDERTRRMEVLVSKMRALGRAAIPLRSEFMASPSPGQRLLAIASMQVAPDFEALDWLIARLPVEKPFVGYHAAVALLVAARDPRAGEEVHLAALKAARAALRNVEAKLPLDSDRSKTLDEFKNLIDRISAD